MPNSFTQIFGGITVYPSQVGFIDYTFTTSTTLYWPTLGETASSLAASFTRITASGAGIVVTLPDADNASVGNALRFKNNGATTFTINSASGSTIATMSAGQDILLSVTDNTTSGGLWDSSYIGSGTTSANASVLAGAGLSTSGATLITNWPVDFTGSNGYVLSTTSVGRVTTWTGGAGGMEIGFDAGTARDGFFTAVKNNGTGILTISGNFGAGIDGAVGSTVQLYPNDSTFIVGAGAGQNFYTIGLTNGLSVGALQLTFTTNTITLTASQAQNKIFIVTGSVASFTGATIVFPNVSGEFVVINKTLTSSVYRSGEEPFIIVQNATGGGTSVRVPLGASRSIVSDGVNMYFADDLSQCRPAQNLIPWGDFSKNPWQRGTSFTSSSVSIYTADKVSVLSPSGSSYTVTRVSSTTTGCQYDMRVQRTSGTTSSSGVFRFGLDLDLSQSIPLRGYPIALAAQFNCGSSFQEAAASFGVWTSTGSNQRIVDNLSNFSLACQGPSAVLTSQTGFNLLVTTPFSFNSTSELLTTTLSQISVLFQYSPTTTADANDYINISRLALIPGTFSGFDNLDAATVLQECQKFAYVPTASAVGQVFGIGQAISANQGVVPIQFPVTMFKAPSLDAGAAAGYQLTNSINASLTVSSITLSGPNSYGAELVITTTASTLIAGQSTRFQALTATSKLVFSADI